MLSIIIPLFNKAESITKTLQCVLDQTFHEFEVLVIDDGSTDKSAEKVQEMLLIDSRLNLIKKQNSGVSSARNEGIRLSKYDYIAFLDADDFWDPTYLIEQVNMIQDFPEASMWGLSWKNIIQNQRIPQNQKISPNFREIVSDYWEQGLHLFWTGAVVVHKSVFNKVGYFDEQIKCGEDLDMWYRIILNYPVAFYNIPLSNYVLDAKNRAMYKEIPLNTHLPYYIGKYAKYRINNEEFCRYFDRECLYRLYPYALKNKKNSEINRVLNQIDFSKQKISFRLRFMFPKMYNWYLNCKLNRGIDYCI